MPPACLPLYHFINSPTKVLLLKRIYFLQIHTIFSVYIAQIVNCTAVYEKRYKLEETIYVYTNFSNQIYMPSVQAVPCMIFSPVDI